MIVLKVIRFPRKDIGEITYGNDDIFIACFESVSCIVTKSKDYEECKINENTGITLLSLVKLRVVLVSSCFDGVTDYNFLLHK